MATIDELTSEQLNNSEILEKIRAMTHGFIIYEEMSNSWNLSKKLENRTRELVDSSPEIYKQYEKLAAQLKFIALPFLTDEQIFDLIEKHSLKVIKAEIDIKRKILAYLTSRSVFVRDQFRKDILIHLKRNQEKIENKTLGEWLLSYDKFAGARKNTSLERTKFITQDIDANKLAEESRQGLLKILEFYDEMKISVPLPIIGVSETTLKEFLIEMRIPLPGEEEKKAPLPKIKIPSPAPTPVLTKSIAKEIKKIPELESEKPQPKAEKPGFFQKLFEGKPKIEKIPEKKALPYKERVSPREKKKELPSKIASILTRPIDIPRPKAPAEEEIPTFPEKKIEAPAPLAKPEIKPMPKPEPEKVYRIRTMKSDIEKIKKQPIPPRPEPKIKDNIVDLSGK